MVERSDGLFVTIGADIAPLRSSLSEASRLSSRFATDLTRAFTDAALKGRDLADVLRQLALSLSAHALEAALAPITRIFSGAWRSSWSGRAARCCRRRSRAAG